jgi:murein DD-endopeptidase MepM/ murein hydrolase activator NlpD
MSNKKFTNGKGYYIALALCALAIGVSGYLYYSHANQEESQLTQQDASVSQTLPRVETDLPVVATQPQQGSSQTPEATQPSATVTRKPMQTASPVEGEIVIVYAMDSLGYNPTTRDWRVHNGVDIAAEEGSAVCAAAEGTVYTVYEDDTMGMTVVIRHQDGYITKYASLATDVSVKAGDTVTLGQQIGYVGNTALLESAIGPHVHFSVTQNDAPVDPADFLSRN